MPAKSKAQQKFMGIVHAIQKGDQPASKFSKSVQKAVKSMKKGDAEDYASTKHKGKPEKVKKETKVRELIKKMVREVMAEGKMRRQLKIPVIDKLKVNKLLKKLRLKPGKDYDIGVGDRNTFVLDIDKKVLNKTLDVLISNRIRVSEDFAGAYPKEKRASFDKKRQKQSEVLGYKLTGTSDVKTEIGDATVKENTMKISKQRLREIIREELVNSQGEETDFKKGDLVKDINPDCPHHNSEGEVTKGGKKKITFKVTNNGPTYKEGDELEKTTDQMVKLNSDEITEAKERNYKEEYKKYGSSTKSKKYRAELNAYNRKKGTYGNGDGKDASHKGGKIAGFEKESVNRGRAEKSRLKKEAMSRRIAGKKLNIPQPSDFDNDMEKYFDALNKHMKEVEKLAKIQKKKKLKKEGKLIEGKFGKFDTGMNFKGNGMTIYDRNQSKGGDFRDIAHISEKGKLTIYDKDVKKDPLMKSD